ncbi:uncharacterized protein LOC128527454 isoform X2 [Clarias gariepinus]|uniref:uncharacterized protein LOC128527454 isoform X2 n=1 Tax=Clarias gariepinus TaxID=13013 RepID=UPI00234CCB87|nr:uncharacterized protein LOC128527454 isoform X2 [Clarias gariepinus]
MLKCKADLPEKRNVTQIHMYLFKNGEIVKMEPFNAQTRDDMIVNLTKVTVEHSGLYTCLFSEEKLIISKTTVTGHNSVSIKVLGDLLPATIEAPKTSVKKEETLTLSCTFKKYKNCTQVYVYLCFNGIGNSKKQVICSDVIISTTFDLSEKKSGNYSCVYSAFNFSLSEVNTTGENTIFVQIRNDSFDVLRLITGVLVAALVLLLVLLGICFYRGIFHFRLCQDPAESTLNNEPFYQEITTGTLYVDENGELRSSGAKSCRRAVENVNVLYSSIQKHKGEQTAEQNANLNIEGAGYDRPEAQYAVINKRKGKTGDEQVMQSFSCNPSVTYSLVNY